MFSWKLWQALRHPPDHHPLTHRVRSHTDWLTLFWYRVVPVYGGAMLLAAAYLIWGTTPPTSHLFGFFFRLVMVFPTTAMLMLLVSPLLFPVVMTGVGALWASIISDHVAEQQEIGIHDLLCVLPGGRWAANWTTACSSIQQDGILEVSWLILRGVLVIGFLLVFGFSMVVGQYIGQDIGLVSMRWFIVDMVALLVGYALYYIQTMALSPLVGLLIPTYVHNRVEGRVWAASLYLVVQIGSVVLGGLLFYLVPLLVGDSAASARILTPYLIGVFVLREALIMLLWGVLLRQLSLTTAEKADVWALVNLRAE